jgi:RNA polymerase sigma factor (sigma-70 family)
VFLAPFSGGKFKMLLESESVVAIPGRGSNRAQFPGGGKCRRDVCGPDGAGIFVQALVAGDERSWGVFVERFYPVIASAVRKTFRTYCAGLDDADVEDVIQEVFLRLCKANCRLLRFYRPDRASLATWVHVIARSMALDFLRRRPVDTCTLDDEALDIAAEDEPPPATVEIPAEILSERQRVVMHLLYDREFSVASVAQMLSVDTQTVRSTRHKALVKLRRHFGVRAASYLHVDAA